MDAPTTLLQEIDAFLVETGMPPTTFGRGAVGDPHFVARLPQRQDIMAGTVHRARSFMEKHRATLAAGGDRGRAA